MEFVSRDWHNSQEHQTDNWDRQVLKNMVMNPHAATAFVDRVQTWAERICVQDAWKKGVEEHDIHLLWTLVSG
eukprot:13118203-Heterocapsa_arctica.AAC.1